MSSKNIDLITLHLKWQKKWNESQIHKTSESSNKPKFYVLDMFPYPSWAWLHVWHPKWYIATDVIARKKMLEWYNVLHPMWWDAFWLPAEQYAIKNKLNPKTATDQNIARYKQQVWMFWFTYDWDREIATTDPEFYKRTQWTFIQFYNHYFDEKSQKAKPISELELKIKNWELKIDWDVKNYIDSQRLAYVDYKPINWCPSCKTWLANEDLEDGKCERCGSDIERKPMRQWVIRITKYAERLLEWLEILPEWVDNIREMQKNWIWKSAWTQFDMEINWLSEKVSVYTTRVDTVFGMSFVSIAPEHPLITKIINWEIKIENLNELENYINEAKKKTDLQRTDLNKNKTWVQVKWLEVINPFNNDKLPLFVADYVLWNYWTWVVMAVPAHDERDYEFAKKYWLNVKTSVCPELGEKRENEETRRWIIAILRNPKTGKYINICWWEELWGNLFVWWGIEWNENPLDTAKREITEETWYKNFKLVSETEKIFAHYRAHSKNVNRIMETYWFLFDLIDEEQIAQNLEDNEKGKFTIDWVDDNVVEKSVNEPTHKYIYNKLIKDQIYTEYGILTDSWDFTNMKSQDAIVAMQKWLENKWIGGKKTNYKLQDWVFSRQRYWGEPIPMINCPKCGIVPMKDSELPLLLPEVENYEPTGTQEWPLAAIDSWINVKCPICGENAKRESNTMPQWAWSSWYYLRYMDPKNNDSLVSKQADQYWNQVDVYVWWAEHATRHLIYARFWHKFLFDLEVVSTQEPFKKLQNVWMILAEDGRKMSKRWGNVINPDDIINEFWSDTMRIYEMFMGPFDQAISWNTNWVKWAKRFLEKVISLTDRLDESSQDSKKLVALLHKTIKKVTSDLDDFRYNTAISQMMILINSWDEQEKINKSNFEKFVIIIAPFIPHLAEELWELLWNKFSIFQNAQWPKYDENLILEDTITLPIQINWKTRDSIEIDRNLNQDQILEEIKKSPKVSKYLEWNEIKKFIYVPWKITNIII